MVPGTRWTATRNMGQQGAGPEGGLRRALAQGPADLTLRTSV